MKRAIFAILYFAVIFGALGLGACTQADIGKPVYGASIIVDKALDFAGEGASPGTAYKVYIVTNHKDWTATKSDEWVRLNTDDGMTAELLEQRILEVWVDDNDDTVNGRTATIVITAGDFSQTLTVTQQAGAESIVLADATVVYDGDAEFDSGGQMLSPDGRGQYDLTFTYGEFDDNGNPLSDDAVILNVACLNRFIPGVYNPEIESGIYTFDTDGDMNALELIVGNSSGATPQGTYYITYVANSEGVREPTVHLISDGRFELDGDGNFKMRFHYKVAGVTEIKRFVYSGSITYRNMEILSAMGAYSSGDSRPINYDLRFYIGKMERNKIIGYGYEVFLECWNDDKYEANSIPAGNYTVGDRRNFTFSAGTPDSGSRLIIYEPVPDDDPLDGTLPPLPPANPIIGGTVSITREQEVYTATFNLTAADGRTIEGQYTGEIRFRAK